MRARLHLALAVLCTAGVQSLASAPARALPAYDVPVITCESATLASITLNVCGGENTGAPAGVTIQWMTKADFDANGGWYASDDPRLCKLSLSGQPSLQHPDRSRWELLPDECETIKIGEKCKPQPQIFLGGFRAKVAGNQLTELCDLRCNPAPLVYAD